MSEEAEERASGTLPPETTVGRATIRVDSLDRVVPFYRDVVGCRVERDGSVARLSASDGRELLVFLQDPDVPPRPQTAAGLFHVAIRLPYRSSLGDALARIQSSGASLTGASDHLVSEALYLRDPAGNGLELYRDRSRDAWRRLDDGRVEMDTLPLDLDDLAAAGDGTAREALPAGTDVGHVHLEVTDLDAATRFYVDGLGLEPSAQDFPGARFLAAGGYHHHVAVNVWNRRTAPAGEHQGLAWFELVLPDEAAREDVFERLAAGDYVHDRGVATEDDLLAVRDPDGIEVRLVLPP